MSANLPLTANAKVNQKIKKLATVERERFLKFLHNRTPSGKKTVTGIQVVTASQVQVKAHFVLHITDGVSVCVAVTKLAQSALYQKAHVK